MFRSNAVRTATVRKFFLALCAIFLMWLVALVSMPVTGLSASDSGRLKKGEAAFILCAGCHTIEKGDANLIGPNLYGIYGRDIASVEGYSYSEQLRSMQGIWDQNRLNRYIARPKLLAPGNEMPFAGITSSHQRSDLIEWLKTNPETFSLSTPETDSMRGSKLAASCTACHTFGKDDANYIGPNLWGVVGRPIASADTFDYSERLMRRKGIWTPAALDEFFREKKEFEQGSHMAFRTLKNVKDRANIISWLSTLGDEAKTTAR